MGKISDLPWGFTLLMDMVEVVVDFPLLISPSFLQKIGIFQRGFAANISQANRGARFAVGDFNVISKCTPWRNFG